MAVEIERILRERSSTTAIGPRASKDILVLSDSIFIFDFDKTITQGLGTDQKVRGGERTLKAMKSLKDCGGTIAVVTARSKVSAGLLTQIQRNEKLYSLFFTPPASPEEETKITNASETAPTNEDNPHVIPTETLSLDGISVQCSKNRRAFACGFHKHVVVAHLAAGGLHVPAKNAPEKKKSAPPAQFRHVYFFDDNPNNAFEVACLSPVLCDEISKASPIAKEARVLSIHSFWCSTFLEEIAGKIGSDPKDPDYPYQDMYTTALAKFGIDPQEMKRRDESIRKKFNQVLQARREARNQSRSTPEKCKDLVS
ncbi:hypothetical protein AAMO2058_001695800 [Amorphochlora amoebiformis]